MIGFGTPGLRNRQPVRDETFSIIRGYSGRWRRIGGRARTVLGDYFDVPVEVEPFVGAWRVWTSRTSASSGDESSRTGLAGLRRDRRR